MSERTGRFPLRIKLVASVLVLVALALFAAGFAATTSLRSTLLGQVDSALTKAVSRYSEPHNTLWIGFDADGSITLGSGPAGSGDGRPTPPNDYYIQLIAPNGRTGNEPYSPAQATNSTPKLPGYAEAAKHAASGKPFTVGSSTGSGRWRVVATPIPAVGGTLVAMAAQPLTSVNKTVGQLILRELIIGLVVLVAIGIIGYVLVRRSLRPLTRIEAVAAAIGAGDLAARIPAANPRTEVGRLSGSLNQMLHQIEGGYRERERSEAAARESEARMRRFIADASHELRTPLTSIRGFSELYRQGAVTNPDDIQMIMGRIEDEAKRMGILVEDLLLLARIDERRPLDRTPVDLREIASNAVVDARMLAPDRHIDLTVAGEPIVLGDSSRLAQVVTNLMTNALRHTPAGTPIAVRAGIVDGEHAFLEVSDSGPGMNLEDASHVFDRFYRSEKSRSRNSGGAGLGLSIVSALVAAHGGTVTLDTSPGRGATFRVTLPLASATQEVPAGRAESPDQDPPTGVDPQPADQPSPEPAN